MVSKYSCRNCGGNIVQIETNYAQTYFQVYCTNCGASGPVVGEQHAFPRIKRGTSLNTEEQQKAALNGYYEIMKSEK